MDLPGVQNIPTAVAVVAGALIAADGRVLMHRRRLGTEHGGLWEFPGGKVEAGESAVAALVRELDEELGITLDPAGLDVLASAHEPGGRIVIDLYICRSWLGDPRCIEGEAIGWYAPGALAALAMPPLDVPLAAALVTALAAGA